MMPTSVTFIAYVAIAGAAGSWLLGAYLADRACARIGTRRARWLAIVWWPAIIGQLRQGAAADAAKANKVLVAFMACVLVAAAAGAAATNLHRIAK
ncbi:MAG: hypothetical protein HY056_15935 [Proteobacteria bacterium]|nr:hypothetical protein [Pseudomonadota bacterium]